MLSIFIYVSVSHPEDTEQPHHSVMRESCLATTKRRMSTSPMFVRHFALFRSRIEIDVSHEGLNSPLASPAGR